jgi:hypothetical protein
MDRACATVAKIGRGMPLIRIEFDDDRIVVQPYGVFSRSAERPDSD